MWNSLATIVSAGFDGSGYLQAINSPVSIARIQSREFISVSAATISDAQFVTRANLSGASVIGIPVVVVWEVKATLSGATTMLRTPIPIHRSGNWLYANFITRTVASGVSAIVDLNKNGTSIFAAVGRPMIAAGGTFASTASIATKGFNRGDRFDLDYDGTGGTITDIIAMLVSE